MITIRPSDYHSLSYDAVAQNKVDQLVGNSYERFLTSNNRTYEVQSLTSTTGARELPLASWDLEDVVSFPDVRYYEGMTGSCTAASSETSKQLPFGGGTTLYIELGHFEYLFTGLNLPENSKVSAQIYWSSLSKVCKDDRGSTIVDAKAEPDLVTMQQRLDKMEVEQQVPNSNSLDNLCIAAVARWDAPSGRGIYPGYWNTGGYQSRNALTGYDYGSTYNITYTQEAEASGLPVELVNVWSTNKQPDFYYKRGFYNFFKTQHKILDRDTVKVSGTVPYKVAIIAKDFSTSSISPFKTYWSYRCALTSLQELRVQLDYPEMRWEGRPFEISANSGNHYPYKFTNTRTANVQDRVRGKLWSEYYPKLIFDKYKDGRYYAQLKVRAKFMLVNNLHIDSEVQIYDLKGKLISRNNQPCVFRIKRIIKSYDNTGFTYTINCLEE